MLIYSERMNLSLDKYAQIEMALPVNICEHSLAQLTVSDVRCATEKQPNEGIIRGWTHILLLASTPNPV